MRNVLYKQSQHVPGLLAGVQNLTGIITYNCCLLVTWTPPFSLTGVPLFGFNVNLTMPSGEEATTKSLLSSSYSFCPDSTIGEYIVTVAGLNAVGQGMTASTELSKS